MDHLFSNLMHDLVRNSEILNDGHGCMMWKGALTESGYGRKKVNWPDGRKREERAQRLAFVVHNKKKYSDMPKYDDTGQQMDVSHICNNNKCIKWTHLILEAHATNTARKTCFASKTCSKRHEPHCLV